MGCALGATVATFGAVALPAARASAATLQVLNSNDSGPGSLRESIADALPGDTVTFAGGPATITLTSGPVAIGSDLTIDGTGSPVITTNGTGGVFTVTGGDVTFDHITVDGLSSSVDGGAINIDDPAAADTATIEGSTFEHDDETGGNDGAAIANVGSSTVDIIGSTFENDDAGSGDGGAVYNGSSAIMDISGGALFEADSAADGGAVYNAHSMGIANANFQGNSASTGGGGAIDDAVASGAAALSVLDSSFVGNSAETNGGAIDVGDVGSEATVTVGSSEFVGNTAVNGSGGAINDSASFPAIYSFVWGSTFVGDRVGAPADGYAIYVGATPSFFQVAGDLFAEDCGGTIASEGYDVALPAGNPSAGGLACAGGAVGDAVSSAAADVTTSSQDSQLMVAQAGNPAVDLIPGARTVDLGDPPVAEQLCPTVDMLGNSGPDTSGDCDAGALQSYFQPASGGAGGGGSGSGAGGSGAGGGSGGGGGGDSVGSAAPRRTITTIVRFDNQRIALVSPSSNVCTAPGGRLMAILSSRAIRHSRRPRLRFSLATLVAGAHVRLTVRHLTAHIAMRLRGLRAGRTDRLTVTLRYRELRRHHRPTSVSRRIAVRFRVC